MDLKKHTRIVGLKKKKKGREIGITFLDTAHSTPQTRYTWARAVGRAMPKKIWHGMAWPVHLVGRAVIAHGRYEPQFEGGTAHWPLLIKIIIPLIYLINYKYKIIKLFNFYIKNLKILH